MISETREAKQISLIGIEQFTETCALLFYSATHRFQSLEMIYVQGCCWHSLQRYLTGG